MAVWLQHRDKQQRERTICEVEVSLRVVLEPPRPTPNQFPGVMVNVINRSEHAVRWEGVAFHRQGGGPDMWLVPTAYLFPKMLPLPIPSRDAASIMLDPEPLEQAGMDWTRPTRVQVWLATGEKFYSEEKPLRMGEPMQLP